MSTAVMGPPPSSPEGPMASAPEMGMAERAQQLYRPRRAGSVMGDRLEQMYREGRREVAANRQRWQQNRCFFRGEQYLLSGAGGLVRQAPTQLLRSGRRRDTVNRLRPMVEGRVSMMTLSVPPYEVIPSGIDQDEVDGARFASKLIRAEWDNVNGWDVSGFLYDWLLAAEQDGLAFGNITYDLARGPVAPMAVVVDQRVPGGVRPVTSRSEYEGLLQQDPEGKVLWRQVMAPSGEVRFRVVRAGWLSIDPSMGAEWKDARYVIESRVRPIEDLERQVGRPLKELVDESNQARGIRAAPSPAPVSVEVDGQLDQMHDPSRYVLVHEAYIYAGGEMGEWPAGAHLMWANQAPGAPFFAAPWLRKDGTPNSLPYFPLVPRPDGGNLLRSISTTEELAPIQVAYNRTHSQINEWMDLVARPPLLVNGGSLRSESVFNEKRLVITNPGFSDPKFMQVPAEPSALLGNRLLQLEREMAELSSQSNASRGQPPGGGVDAYVAIQRFIAQDEQSMSGTARRFKAGIEWAISEALALVEEHYTVPRLVVTPGVDDEEELTQFVGAKLRGATRFRITGSLLPRQRAAQVQMLMQFLQLAGPRFDPTPFAAEIIEGDIDYIITAERAQSRAQERENRMIARLGANPARDEIWKNFIAMRDAYAKTMQALMEVLKQKMLTTGIAPPMTPQQMMAQVAPPPKVVDLIAKVDPSIQIPRVEDTDSDAAHIKSIAQFASSDGFRNFHPIVQQVLREHHHEHLAKIARNVAAMGRQQPPEQMAPQGSPPAEKGEAPRAKVEPADNV